MRGHPHDVVGVVARREGRRANVGAALRELRTPLLQDARDPAEIVAGRHEPEDDEPVPDLGAGEEHSERCERVELLVRARDDKDRAPGLGRRRRAPSELALVAVGWSTGDELELGILAQDRPLERLERRARVDPELVDERPPSFLVAIERLGLPPGAVERAHQLATRSLAQRISREQLLELADQLGRSSELEVGLDPLLEHGEPQLLEPGDRALGERLEGEVRERRAAPERKRLAERPRRRLGIAGPEPPRALLRELLESAQVDLGRAGDEDVAGLPGHDRLGPEHLAELRDVDLDHVRRGLGRPLAPEVVDQPVDGDELVRAQEQHREERPLLRASEGELTLRIDGLERPEEPELHPG